MPVADRSSTVSVRAADGTGGPDGAHLLDATAPDDARRAAGAWARALQVDAALDLSALDPPSVRAAVEGVVLGGYRFTEATRELPPRVTVAISGAADDDLAAGRRAAAATALARDLANTRSNVKTPAWLGARAVEHLAPLAVEVAVRDEGWLAEAGFGGTLAVGAGSAVPPRLIEARWRPRGARKGVHVVLVGKGITFDTGGINRKPGAAMNTMYTDMAGGAAVLGAVHAIAAAKVPVHVSALVPTAQNSMSGGSFRPGDVVRHAGGRTSEITNTDAEGRLVLADALAHAIRTLRPTAVVDIATLTGAAKMALGLRTGGLFATSDPLAEALIEAGAATGEPLWRLPLTADYEGLLASSIADAVSAPGAPGAVTAALFLRHFVGDVPWAHLDIAGPGRAAADDGPLSRGATGFGARLLAAWVAGLA